MQEIENYLIQRTLFILKALAEGILARFGRVAGILFRQENANYAISGSWDHFGRFGSKIIVIDINIQKQKVC